MFERKGERRIGEEEECRIGNGEKDGIIVEEGEKDIMVYTFGGRGRGTEVTGNSGIWGGIIICRKESGGD